MDVERTYPHGYDNLKLPEDDGWKFLLKEYYVIVREEVEKEEDDLYEEYNKQRRKIPKFLRKGAPSLQGTEEKYITIIMRDLLKEGELNSYKYTDSVIDDPLQYDLNMENYRQAWNKVSTYLTSFHTLQNDVREKIEGLGQNSIPVDSNLQVSPLPNG